MVCWGLFAGFLLQHFNREFSTCANLGSAGWFIPRGSRRCVSFCFPLVGWLRWPFAGHLGMRGERLPCGVACTGWFRRLGYLSTCSGLGPMGRGSL